MKRLLISLAIVGAVGGTVFATTSAFFSDTETSTGNTFTAGSLDLQVQSQCTYNGVTSSQCGNWTYEDLQNGVALDKFFNFSDIKPGDWGENTISFRVLDNPAWMCANLSAVNNENDLVEPETDANDLTPGDTAGLTNGELGKYLEIAWWVDDGDNVYENEQLLYGGPRTLNEWLALGTTGSSLPLTFADSYMNWVTGTTAPVLPIPENEEQHLGVAWCFGDLTLDGNGITCVDTDLSQDDAQTDSVVGTLAFSIEQFRNNTNYLCPEHQPE